MHHARFHQITTIAVCALLTATAARAQERPSEFENHVIPGWSFTPGFTITSLWHSNVALADRLPETGTTASDRLLVFVPSGQLELVSPRTGFTAGYRGSLRRHMDVEELDGFDQRAFVGLRHRLTPRLELLVQNEFTEAPTTDRVELNGVPFARIGSRSNNLAAEASMRLTKLTDLHVRYDNAWTAFDRLESFVADGTIHGVQVRLRRRLTPRATFGGEARIRRSDVTRTGPRVIWFRDAGATFDYRLTEFLTLRLAGGLSQLRDNRFEETRNAPYYRIELQRSVERATLGVRFERSYTPSFAFSGSNDNQELRGFVRMPFYRNRFYVQGDGVWRRGNPFFPTDLRYDTFVTSATVGYSATRWLRTEAYHAFSLQDSIITGGEVDRHRIGVQLVVSQPMRIR